MKNVSIFLVVLCICGIPSIAFSQGYALFPHESAYNLFWMATDSEIDSFVIRNRNGEEVTGYVGDFIGYEEAEVVQVTTKFITIQTFEIIINKNGKEHEQPSRMRIPVSFGFDGKGKGSK